MYIYLLSYTDEDSNGTIDHEELKKCLNKLQLHLTEDEIDDLFDSCDMDGREGIQFNEFIVLLCLIYLLMDPTTSPQKVSTTRNQICMSIRYVHSNVLHHEVQF